MEVKETDGGKQWIRLRSYIVSYRFAIYVCAHDRRCRLLNSMGGEADALGFVGEILFSRINHKGFLETLKYSIAGKWRAYFERGQEVRYL